MTVPRGPRPVRVALDLLGGDRGPEVVADAARLVSEEQPGVDLVLVGPPGLAAPLLHERGLADRFRTAPATRAVGMAEDAVRVVRADPEASVGVAARLLAAGDVDAVVSIGPTGAVLAAATLSLDRLPGVGRVAVAAVVPAVRGRVLLLDAGATPDADSGLLAEHALCGAAYARAALGVDRPRVGLLTIGAEPDKGDSVRRGAHALLARLPVDFVGNVEGGEVCLGGLADVVVTDGFTGNIVLKAIEGAMALATARLSDAGGDGAAAELRVLLDPDRHAGAVLLGLDGVVVVGHGASSPRAVATCVSLAVGEVRGAVVRRTAAELSELMGRPVAGADRHDAKGVAR